MAIGYAYAMILLTFDVVSRKYYCLGIKEPKKKKVKCRTVGIVSSMDQRLVQLRFFFLSFSLFYVHIRAMVCVLKALHTASSEMA